MFYLLIYFFCLLVIHCLERISSSKYKDEKRKSHVQDEMWWLVERPYFRLHFQHTNQINTKHPSAHACCRSQYNTNCMNIPSHLYAVTRACKHFAEQAEKKIIVVTHYLMHYTSSELQCNRLELKKKLQSSSERE